MTKYTIGVTPARLGNGSTNNGLASSVAPWQNGTNPNADTVFGVGGGKARPLGVGRDIFRVNFHETKTKNKASPAGRADSPAGADSSIRMWR